MMNLKSKLHAHQWVCNCPMSFVNTTGPWCVVQLDCVCFSICCVSTAACYFIKFCRARRANILILTFVITSFDRHVQSSKAKLCNAMAKVVIRTSFWDLPVDGMLWAKRIMMRYLRLCSSSPALWQRQQPPCKQVARPILFSFKN